GRFGASLRGGGRVQNGRGGPGSVRDIYRTASESDQRARGWRIRDRRHVGGGDRRRPCPARRRVHHLARRQGAAVAHVVVHQVHGLDEIAVQRNEQLVISGQRTDHAELIETFEVK